MMIQSGRSRTGRRLVWSSRKFLLTCLLLFVLPALYTHADEVSEEEEVAAAAAAVPEAVEAEQAVIEEAVVETTDVAAEESEVVESDTEESPEVAQEESVDAGAAEEPEAEVAAEELAEERSEEAEVEESVEEVEESVEETETAVEEPEETVEETEAAAEESVEETEAAVEESVEETEAAVEESEAADEEPVVEEEPVAAAQDDDDTAEEPNYNENFDKNPPDFLTEESVILITGAAGFLGSELAMALHRAYSPKKILLVDSMDKGFGTLTESQLYSAKTEQDLALFEFKRQRVFHTLQVIGASGYFYRVDFRPSVPEFFDTSEVPVLHHIFEDHDDITHVVHFADHYHHGHLQERDPSQQAVPRLKGQPKAGMMEAILEQIRLVKSEGRRVPHLTYASSSDVYNHVNPGFSEPNKVPFDEGKPLTTPSSMTGASKLMDELLAQAYYRTEKIYSVGLRYFSVYGPWGLPGSPIFEMADRIVTGDSPLIQGMELLDDVRDYIYIDDAIDATMAAMQMRPSKKDPPPLVINVGTGEGLTLRQIAKEMQSFFPDMALTGMVKGSSTVTTSYASTKRAEELLGFRARKTLREGLQTLLAWHYDRTYPYGGDPEGTTQQIAGKGVVACSRYDSECLKGTPVFPCASECSHVDKCITSFWDDILEFSRALTKGCTDVMYTVALEDDLSVIPSSFVQVSSGSDPFVVKRGAHCNVAFVSEDSPLYQAEVSYNPLTSKKFEVHMHGPWALVPVKLTQASKEKMHILKVLPKLSPGQFFYHAVRRAVYCDKDIIFDSVTRLLDEASMQPKHSEIEGETAILIGKGRPHPLFSATVNVTSPQDMVQNHAYRTIRIAVIEEMMGDGFAQMVDSSFLVHSLGNEDGRLFRCDVLGEVVQWDVSSDRSAFEFIMGLHDMWSRVIAKKMGHEPWWIGESIETVPVKNPTMPIGTTSRRLEEVASASLRRPYAMQHRRLQEEDIEDLPAAEGMWAHNGFGLVEGAVNAFFGDGDEDLDTMTRRERPDGEKGDDMLTDDFEMDDELNRGIGDLPILPGMPSDPSSYDVWMGILSSTSVRYFGRIVTMEAVGALHVDDEGNIKVPE